MRSFVLAALVVLAAAHPSVSPPGPPPPPPPPPPGDATCISAPDASLIATNFGMTISNYTEPLADQLFTNNFTDQSDSVLTLMHEPGLQAQDLGRLTFSSKANFLAAQGAQPNVPFEILNLWNTCNTVIIRWLSAQTPLPVQGISVATVQPAIKGQGGGFGTGAQKWQINNIVAEFNSGAWLGNLGYPECGTSPGTTGS
ncbi:hypothetical protein E4T50_14003 [Aureobasidium sp. EXF-12298]|nr:hypothetical protein E4T50_14003 [Aureobasidium sp. EXF-12298]KAI4755274.1 hypothetical protein E4T51_11628 [Aureobasidium sp. EXF-12344]KAI4779508.1 hypothetical protein E4T52_05548 [Aureobasidium sp. EXF-3400]